MKSNRLKTGRQKSLRVLVWFSLLTKRLLKNKILWVTLLLIPLVALAMRLATKEEGDLLRIALYTEDSDAMAQTVVERLVQNNGVCAFLPYESADEAVTAVKNGEADAAWGFVSAFGEKLSRYAADRSEKETLVAITEQEGSVFLDLSKEYLYGAIIPTLSEQIYLAYLENELHYDVAADVDRVRAIFEEAHSDDELVRFSFVDSEKSITSVRYLRTPLRGMIAVITVIGGLSAAMVFLREKEKGLYALLSERQQLAVLIGTCLSALLLCGASALLSLWLAGTFGHFAEELLYMLLYVLMCTGFCTLIALVSRKASVCAVLLPLIAVLLLVFCPIFINHKMGMPLPLFLPTYHYLQVAAGRLSLMAMPLYTLSVLFLCWVVNELFLLKGRVHRTKRA